MNEIEALLKKYRDLDLSAAIDFDRFSQYAIVHHSSTIEGSTLTQVETQLLLEEGITPNGKPLEHSLMVKDHFAALQFVLSAAMEKKPVTADFIRHINACVLKGTGKVYHTVFGTLDSADGVFRKGNVSAGESYFVNYDKVEAMIMRLCEKIGTMFTEKGSLTDHLDLSFDAQFDLLTIHPFYDGNGRTARLLMNYIQLVSSLPMAIVFKEDKADYYEALVRTRKQEDITVFRFFMYTQYKKLLQEEIAKAATLKNNGSNGKGYSLIF